MGKLIDFELEENRFFPNQIFLVAPMDPMFKDNGTRSALATIRIKCFKSKIKLPGRRLVCFYKF
jgi:hypothetical protein